MKLFSTSAKAGHGKDTAVDHIISTFSEKYTIVKKSWAFKLKQIVAIITDTTLQENLTAEGKKMYIEKYSMTLGEMQQKVGTGLRQRVDEQLWVKSLFIETPSPEKLLTIENKLDLVCTIIAGSKYLNAVSTGKQNGIGLNDFDGLSIEQFRNCVKVGVEEILNSGEVWSEQCFQNRIEQWCDSATRQEQTNEKCENNEEIWIVVDSRFPNEIETIENRGGQVIRIVRPGFLIQDGRDNNHISETALDDWQFKNEIINDGTLEEFKNNVAKLFEQLIQ